MGKKGLTVFLVVMSIGLLFAINFTVFSQNQIYLLKNYQTAYTDYQNKDFQIKEQIYYFENSEIVATKSNTKLKTGIAFGESTFKVYTNNQMEEIKYSDYQITNLESLFTNYLVYKFSLYTSVVVLFGLLVKAVWYLLICCTTIYFTKRIYDHFQKRNEIYFKEKKISEEKFEISLVLFIISFIYAYAILFSGQIFSQYSLLLIGPIIYMGLRKNNQKKEKK